MDFKKKHDYEDLSNFIPDNIMIGTEQYFKKRYKNLPEHVLKLLEVKTKDWYNEKDEEDVMKDIQKQIQDYNNKLLKELAERCFFEKSTAKTPEDECFLRKSTAKTPEDEVQFEMEDLNLNETPIQITN